MKRILAALLMFLALSVQAAPQASGPQECAAFGDMSLVASAFSRQKVDKTLTFAAMREIYSGGMSDERVVKIMSLIVDAAYLDAARELLPSNFAGIVLGTCMNHRGNMDAILGTDA